MNDSNPPKTNRRRYRFAGFLVLGAWLLPSEVWGNAGPPTRGGTPFLVEPVGIKDVEIVREHLSIDLRGFASGRPAQVEAVYQLRNRGPEQKLDLVFVTGASAVLGFQIRLGDEPVASRPAEDLQLPAEWQLPATTPDIYGRGGVPYYTAARNTRTVKPMAFTLLLAPGPHTLQVRYGTHGLVRLRDHGRPTVYHQLAYVLAPARSWAGFGGLDISVQLPPGWRAASVPALQRDGDALTGSFSDVPADALALTIQAPEGWAYHLVKYAATGFFILAALGGGVLCWYGGWSKGRRLPLTGEPRPGWLKRHAWPRSLGLGLLWSVAFPATALLALLGPDSLLPAGQQSDSYGKAWIAIGAFIPAVPLFFVGFVLAQSTAIVTHQWRDSAAQGRHQVTQR